MQRASDRPVRTFSDRLRRPQVRRVGVCRTRRSKPGDRSPDVPGRARRLGHPAPPWRSNSTNHSPTPQRCQHGWSRRKPAGTSPSPSTGDAGDELFGGYDRYRAVALATRMDRLSPAIRGWLGGPVARRIPTSVRAKTRLRSVKRFLERVDQTPERRYPRLGGDVRRVEPDRASTPTTSSITSAGSADRANGVRPPTPPRSSSMLSAPRAVATR